MNKLILTANLLGQASKTEAKGVARLYQRDAVNLLLELASDITEDASGQESIPEQPQELRRSEEISNIDKQIYTF